MSLISTAELSAEALLEINARVRGTLELIKKAGFLRASPQTNVQPPSDEYASNLHRQLSSQGNAKKTVYSTIASVIENFHQQYISNTPSVPSYFLMDRRAKITTTNHLLANVLSFTLIEQVLPLLL